jgi:hypothetical protein
VAGGYKAASRDPEIIRRWFAARPDADVAVCPGACEPPLVALDVDRKGGVDGLASLMKVDEDLALTAETVAAQRTPSGGLHILFRAPGPTKNTVGAIGPGLDTRGANGYIVVYADLPPAAAAPPAPEWLVRAVAAKATKPAERSTKPAGPEAIAAARLYLSNAPIAVQGQGGNNTAYRVACQLINLGLTGDQALTLMLEEWNPRCVPPWSGEELADLAKTVASAARNSQDGPRMDGVATLAEALAKAKTQSTATEKPSRWKVWYGNEFADRPAPRWLVPGLIQADSLALIVGKYGSFKSFVALDVACALASGRPVLGRTEWTPEAERLKVLYCAGEGVADLAVRYRAYAKHRGLQDIPDIGFTEDVPRIAEMLANKAASDEFRALVDAHDVLIIDTLARAAVGLDENDNALMSATVDWLDRLRTGRPADRPLTIIVVHHTGKSGEEPRGASALPAAADVILRVEKLGAGIGALHAAKFKAAAGWDEPIRLIAETVDLEDAASIVLRAVASGISATVASRRAQAADDNIVAAALASLDVAGVVPADELPSIVVQSLTEFDGEPADIEWMLPGHPVLRRVASALRRLTEAAPEHNGLRLLPGGVYYARGAYAKSASLLEDSS